MHLEGVLQHRLVFPYVLEITVTTTSSDDRWVERLRGPNPGRDAALAELREIILRGLNRSLSSHPTCRAFQAEDVVQEALVKIMNALDSFEGRSRFTTWAMTIATRVGISELRRRHCKDISLDGVTTSDGLTIDLAVAEAAATGEDIDKRSILSQLQQLIGEVLSDKQRVAIRGLLEGLPVEEIADRTGSNRNAVYKLVHDARSKLKEGFLAAGIEADDISELFA